MKKQTIIKSLELALSKIEELQTEVIDFDQEQIVHLKDEISNLNHELNYYKNQRPTSQLLFHQISVEQQTAMRLYCEFLAPKFLDKKIQFIKTVRSAFPNIGLAGCKYIVEEYYHETKTNIAEDGAPA